jgi:hypothetical protein
VRRECLDRLLILGRHLQYVLASYVLHTTSTGRTAPSRSCRRAASFSRESQGMADVIDLNRVGRRDLLDGLIREYRRAA